MDINLLTIIAIIGGLFLIPALLVGRAVPRMEGHWPRHWRMGLAAAGVLLCLGGLAGGWLTLRADYRSLLGEPDVSTLRLPAGEPAPGWDDTRQNDFLVTLIVRDRLRGEDPILLDQARISMQSAVRGNLKTIRRGDREFLWRVMINPPRLTDNPGLESDVPVWAVVGSAGFVARGGDPVRDGGPFGFSLSQEDPVGQITMDLPQRQPAFGFLVAGHRLLNATMVFEPIPEETELEESPAANVLARYGEAMPPLDYSPPPRGRDAVAIHLAQYLKAAAAPLGAGVLLLALGFARHRVPALAVICAAVLWGVALNERIALGHHLRQAADDEAPLPVRMAAVQHADATFFWGHRAGEGLRSLKETEVELPEDLRRVLAARGQARPAESENGVEP